MFVLASIINSPKIFHEYINPYYVCSQFFRRNNHFCIFTITYYSCIFYEITLTLHITLFIIKQFIPAQFLYRQIILQIHPLSNITINYSAKNLLQTLTTLKSKLAIDRWTRSIPGLRHE